MHVDALVSDREVKPRVSATLRTAAGISAKNRTGAEGSGFFFFFFFFFW